MFRFGISGIPLSCKGRTLMDAVIDVHTMGLSAIEVQFLRLNTGNRPVYEEEVGLVPTEINELVMEVHKNGDANRVLYDFTKPLENGDVIKYLSSTTSMAKNISEIKKISAIGQNLDISISMHAPYYLSFNESPELEKRSMDVLKWTLIIATHLKAGCVIAEMGIANNDKEVDKIFEVIESIDKWIKHMKLPVLLGIGTSSKKELFGSIDDIVTASKKYSTIFPVLNFAHLYGRDPDAIKTTGSILDILDKTEKVSKGQSYISFSGVEVKDGNIRMTPIKRSDFKIDGLMEALIRFGHDATIISTSPLLEHDAIYMKLTYEKMMTKYILKRQAISEKETNNVKPPEKKHIEKGKKTKEIEKGKKTKEIEKGKKTKEIEKGKKTKEIEKGKKTKKIEKDTGNINKKSKQKRR